MSGRNRARWGDGRIEVSAKWQRISGALAEGWPLTRIYEQHIDGEKISYSQFRRQVQKRLGTSQAATEPAPAAAPIPSAEPASQQPKRVGPIHARSEPASRNFDYKPADQDDRDSLIGPKRS